MEEGVRRGALRALENLIDTILNADRVFSVEFLFNAFEGILPPDIDFTIILREGRRFIATDRDRKHPYLNFNFLSFGWERGQLHRFADANDVDERVKLLQASSDHDLIEQEKLLCFVPSGTDEENRDMIKATARCLGAFYYTCGNYDHFITNVSTRFVRDYFKQHKQFEVEDIVEAVQGVCGVRVAYLNTLSTADNALSMVDNVTVVADPTRIYKELAEDADFAEDLHKSFLRKIAIVGQTASGYNYSIHTLGHEYFDHSRPLIETAGREGGVGERYFAYAPRGIVVTAVKDTHLRLDVLSLGPRIFRAYVNDRIFSAREEFFYGLLRDGGKLADRLLVQPAETGEALREFLYPVLETACSVLVQLTFASSVAIRAFDPLEHSLLRVASSRQHQLKAPTAIESVPIKGVDRYASARAFSGRVSEGLDARSHRSDNDGEALGAKLSLDFGSEAGHVASIPIKVGSITLGTLDFFTNDRKFFANDRQYLEIAASAIGELIRRVEAANDSAWLSRLSFLHSARHELGRFSRDLEGTDARLAEQLHDILRQYSSLDNSLKDLTLESFDATMRSIMRKHKLTETQIEPFLAPINTALADRSIPPLSLLLIQEVLENLLHNARAHSNLRLEDFQIRYLGLPDGPPDAVMIYYCAEGSPRHPDVLGRLCVAPIPEAKTTSYHYGLFLLATQLRMAGGYAAGRRNPNYAQGAASFEVTFGIPLT